MVYYITVHCKFIKGCLNYFLIVLHNTLFYNHNIILVKWNCFCKYRPQEICSIARVFLACKSTILHANYCVYLTTFIFDWNQWRDEQRSLALKLYHEQRSYFGGKSEWLFPLPVQLQNYCQFSFTFFWGNFVTQLKLEFFAALFEMFSRGKDMRCTAHQYFIFIL